MAERTIHHDVGVVRNWRLLEFTAIFLVVAVCLWLMSPGLSDSMKLAHETAVKQCASALKDSVHFLQLQRLASSNTETTTQRAIRSLQSKGNAVRREDCQAIWLGLLGDGAPTASLQHSSVFFIRLSINSKDQLACRYEYTLAGNMFIDYFPKSDVVVVDNVFE